MLACLWQQINVGRHTCHWWQETIRRRITAMTLLILFLALTSLLVLLVRVVGHDGYGSNPAPRSHRPDMFDPLIGRWSA